MDGRAGAAIRATDPVNIALPPSDTITNNSLDSSDGGDETRGKLQPGMLVVISVDPIATLRPLFEGDDAVEKAAIDMYPRMRRYVGFLRGVEHRHKGSQDEEEPIGEENGLSTVRSSVHLNLLHTERPARSKYDTIDESMCVPLTIDRPTSPALQRQNSGRRPRLAHTPSRKPIQIQNGTDPLPWKELYAHTIMDAFAAISDVDCSHQDGGEVSSSPLLSPKDMQRYDGYQAIDRTRESTQYQKAREQGVDAGDVADEGWEDEVDYEEEEDESQFRLSTVISGLTIDDDASLGDQLKTVSNYSPSLRVPSPRVASPTSSGLAPSAWRGKSIRIGHQPSRPQLDYISAKDVAVAVPPPLEPLSPKSPTMTGTSGETNETKISTNSLSTQATSLHDPDLIPSPSPVRCERDLGEEDVVEVAGWDLAQLELGGGLGANKPSRRQCAIHIRVWLDLSREDVRNPEDPRTFFEELKMLRALEKTSDMRYVVQQKQANAQRVLEWRVSMNSKPVKSPSKSSLSLTPFSTSHTKHFSVPCHNPFRDILRRTSMPNVSSRKSRQSQIITTQPAQSPAILIGRRSSSIAREAREKPEPNQISTLSSFKKAWRRLTCSESR